MKICYLFKDYVPQKKCGDAIAGAFINGGLGLAGTAMSSVMQSNNQNKQIGYQLTENNVNRDWQSIEAEKARQWQAGQTLQQNAVASQLQSQQQAFTKENMALQAKYNSPVYQRRQLEAAGINPQVYFGQQSSFSGSSAPAGAGASVPAAGSSPMVGSVSGISPVPYQTFGTQMASILSSIGSSIRDVAQARKLGIEADWIPKDIKARVRNLESDADLKEFLAVGQTIHNELQRAKLPYAVQQAEADLYKVFSEIDFNKEKCLTEQSQRELNDAIKAVQNSLKQLNEKEIEKMGLEMPYYVNLLKAKINDLSASASEHRENATYQSYMNDIYSSRAVRDELVSQLYYATDNMLKDGIIKDEMAKQIKYASEQLKLQNDNFGIKMWSDIIYKYLSLGKDYMEAAGKYGAIKRFLDAKKYEGNNYGSAPNPYSYPSSTD